MNVARLRIALVAVAAALVITVPLLPQQAEAQDRSRWRVLVADMKPTDDSRERFGERVSDRLRDIINVPTHVAMSERDTDQAAREYDLRRRDLDCIYAVQLASRIDVRLIFCGDYETEGGDYRFTGRFITVPGGDEFVVGPHRVPSGDERAAADMILDEFEVMVETVRTIEFCGAEFNSQNWDQALDYCTRAVDLAPESDQARFALARTQLELENYEESLENFQVLLEERPDDDRYLQNAGWVAAQLDQRDLAREYYHRYLDINPDDASVRLNVAHELAQIDDFYGAMSLVEEGVERDPENIDLHEFYGLYAFRAAIHRQETQPQPVAQDGDAPSLDPEVAELFRTAIESLHRVIEARGSEARPSYVVNSVRAYRQLGEAEEAIRVGEAGAQLFPENDQLWSDLAGAYNEAGQVDRAIEAMERVITINPNFANARTRLGNFLLEADRVEEGIEAMTAANEAGEQTPDGLGQILNAAGFRRVQGGQFQTGVQLIEAAKGLNVSDRLASQLNFFHGYALMLWGERVQEPQTLEAAQRALSMFQQGLRLVDAGREYGEATPGANWAAVRERIEAFIDIQEAVIAREGRRR